MIASFEPLDQSVLTVLRERDPLVGASLSPGGRSGRSGAGARELDANTSVVCLWFRVKNGTKG
jgi:hypothetical protein